MTGHRSKMSQSQAYPLAFGRAIARQFRVRYLYKDAVVCNHATRGLPRYLFSIVPEDAWQDAGVPDALALLRGHTSVG